MGLGEKSKVEPGEAFTGWGRFTDWGPEGALERLRSHRPGPLDLEVDLQEEVVLREWSVGKAAEEEALNRKRLDRCFERVRCLRIQFPLLENIWLQRRS